MSKEKCIYFECGAVEMEEILFPVCSESKSKVEFSKISQQSISFRYFGSQDSFIVNLGIVEFIPFLQAARSNYLTKNPGSELIEIQDISEKEWRVLKLYASQGIVENDESVEIINFFGVYCESLEELLDFHAIRLQESEVESQLSVSS
jgi:hypothetical protein